MRSKSSHRTLLLTVLIVAGLNVAAAQQQPAGRGRFDVPGPPRLTLSSTSFNDLAVLPPKHTCLAQPAGISPELHWINVPAGTVSFVVMFHDLDPRVNKGNDDTMHWMVWNIPPNVSQLPEGMSQAQLPAGAIQGKYVPNGLRRSLHASRRTPHHYSFEIHAMETILDVPAEGTRADVNRAMDGHILDHALIIAYWARPLQ